MIAMPSGITSAPPIPWSTRQTISMSMEGASPQRAVKKVNRPTEPRYARLVPRRSVRKPVAGMKTASASMYAVRTSWP
jgi:hypothetical protein